MKSARRNISCKIRLIVIRYDAYAFGQIFTDFLQFFMERFNDACRKMRERVI